MNFVGDIDIHLAIFHLLNGPSNGVVYSSSPKNTLTPVGNHASPQLVSLAENTRM